MSQEADREAEAKVRWAGVLLYTWNVTDSLLSSVHTHSKAIMVALLASSVDRSYHHGVYSREASISFSTSDGVASIQGRC